MPTVTLTPRSADSVTPLLVNRNTVGARQILRKIQKGMSAGQNTFNISLTPGEGEELSQTLVENLDMEKKAVQIKSRNPSDEWSAQGMYSATGGRG